MKTSEVVALTQALVRIDSRNPPGDERPAVALLTDHLQAIGATCRIIEPEPRRQSLIAEIGPAHAPSLVVCGHLDTVGVYDRSAWTFDPFGAEIDGDRLVGRGSADMKGGVAVAVTALARALASGPLGWRVRLLLVADEEAGAAHGAARLAAKDLRADLAIVTEPTSLVALHAEHGVAWVRFSVRGRSSHAGLPHEGRSAVAAAAELVRLLQTPRRGHPHLVEANAGTVAGGSAPNLVAAHTELRVDRRLTLDETPESVAVWAEGHAADVGARWGVAVDSVVEDFCSASASSPDDPALRGALGALDPGGRGGTMVATTDARFLRAAGTPTLVWGPGSLRAAHTADESVSITELLAATERLTALYRAESGPGPQPRISQPPATVCAASRTNAPASSS